MAKITKSTLDKTFRLLLRMLPIIPGPELFDIFSDLNESKKSVNKKIDEAYSSLRNTSALIQDLQSELNERTNKLKILKDKYEEYSKLAEIEEEKIKPLFKEIERTLGKGRIKERVLAFLLNITAGLIIFFLGVWLSPKITQLFGSNTKINNNYYKNQKDSLNNIIIDSLSQNKEIKSK